MIGKIITSLAIFLVIFFSVWFIEAKEMTSKLKTEQSNRYESEWSDLEIEAGVTEFAPREYVKIKSVS
ncbi:hypothetical protein P4U90_01660 [Cytobacillus kochii]|uniref:hypothetical protein n=1 Tax=Cytobacillus kochii TaxID=859143 RepID=UPI002E1EC38F|nr:hypothetical protein [Cytobacillus kochii]